MEGIDGVYCCILNGDCSKELAIMESKQRVLCLGMSYPCVASNVRLCKGTSKGEVWHPPSEEQDLCSVEGVANLVRTKILTEMDGRDLVRCCATERLCGVDVFCVSQERGAIYRGGRHTDCNFNSRHFVEELRKLACGAQFDQIVLDYFWSPSGWVVSHWKRSFFAKNLVALASLGLLRPVARHPQVGVGGCRMGVVYLPFCLHTLRETVAAFHDLSFYYRVSFLTKDELAENALWAGTQTIDSSTMLSVFGKRLDQEEIYCRVTEQQLRSVEDEPHVRRSAVLDFLTGVKDVSAVRFLVLELLPVEENGIARTVRRV